MILLLTVLGLLTLPLATSAQGNSQNARACTNGGYLNYTNAQGRVFANEGECVQYAAQGNTLQPVVTEDPAVTRCKQEAIAAGFAPSAFNIIAGTEGDDTFTPTIGPDLFCGFGGNDSVGTLSANDVFLGGDGNDSVDFEYGTFNGGAGNDSVFVLSEGGTFNGGGDSDSVTSMYGGTFNGGAGDDSVTSMFGTLGGGTFNQD